MNNTIKTNKKAVIRKAIDTFKYWMTDKEFTGILVGKEATNSEYVISDGLIESGGFIPDHYHKWEDQTFHIQQGILEAKIGDEIMIVETGDAIHCPRGVSHYMKNIGKEDVKMVSYIFPGDWAEDFFTETSKQVKSGKKDLELIEKKFGVVYL